MKRLRAFCGLQLCLALLLAAGCGNAARPLPALTASRPQGAPAYRWVPSADASYQIQYTGKLDMRVAAQIYDLDGFDTPPSVVSKLHALKRRAICYVDAGTWENWRPDAKDFPKKLLGEPVSHWPGERWLDVRQTAILEPIMSKRLDLCKQKGFDGVDPDNIDGYTNDTGFSISGAQQLAYDLWLASAAHARGLAVAQKNDNGQVAQLSKAFDFAVVEQCYAQGWCKQFALYTKSGRLVVDVEYGLSEQTFLTKTCASDARYDETAILKKLQLTAWVVTCSKGAHL
ncbi:MAG: endo alpha-1,4 polygalactosaminidase [Candidatus Eremiobacteraeota bacterium]|nr:endo alpha-1,4 polygalactosaminidase [Candidatus Eremiobacteraeota bacterium]